MYEVDFLPIGDGDRSGLAVAMRFTRADTGAWAHVIVDGGFQPDGEKVVNTVTTYYETSHIDAVILTHPDGDHIGGLGTVIRDLDVDLLLAHRLSQHGGSSFRASDAIEDLISVANGNGTEVAEPFAGIELLGGALVIAGPDPSHYEELVAEQVAEAVSGKAAAAPPSRIAEAVAKMSARVMQHFPVEIPFDDAGGVNPRNNSSAIVDIRTADDKRFMFTGDAGAPALDRALDQLDNWGRTDRYPDVIQVPHHGSRHNASSKLLDRLLGPGAQTQDRAAFVSISQAAAKDPRYPSPRVANAYGRRGYHVYQTAGLQICEPEGVPSRPNWTSAQPLPPLDEEVDDR